MEITVSSICGESKRAFFDGVCAVYVIYILIVVFVSVWLFCAVYKG